MHFVHKDKIDIMSKNNVIYKIAKTAMLHMSAKWSENLVLE